MSSDDAAPSADGAIRALLEEAAAALRTGDWSRYQAVWAHESWIELIHPAEGEWLRGWEAIGKGYRELLESGARPDPQRRLLRVRAAPSGEMAWATAEALVRRPGLEPAEVTLWQTFVFERAGGSWRLVHGHASVPASPAAEASAHTDASTHVTIPTLETERLRLRPFRPDDTDAYAAMCADPEFMRGLGSEPLPRGEAWRQMATFVGHWYLRGFGLWAVEEKARPGVLIGRIGCYQPEEWPDFEVGWALARPYWGRGYATEGARAAVSYAFEHLGRPRVVSLIAPENRPSIRVAERLGERLVGEAELRGHRVLVYAIEREAWSAARL